MSDHRYILTPYQGPATRHTCPACGERHKFSRYIDTTIGEELGDNCGRCDREDNCGYHFTPKQFFSDNPTIKSYNPEPSPMVQDKEQINRTIDFLPFELMDKSVTNHKRCDLFPFLEKLFGKEIASWLCINYFIGTNREGNTVFWQVDVDANIRQCKIIQYMPNGHRNKETGAIFAGKNILNTREVNFKQSFFGEHLLTMPGNENKPIAIVESEKTCIISSVYYPEFTWLATGGKHGCKWTEQNVCKVLAGRSVILFPDIGAFDLWNDKAHLLTATAGCKVVVSDLLEKNANDNDRKQGLDIADYLLRDRDSSELALTDPVDQNNQGYPVIWDYKIKIAS